MLTSEASVRKKSAPSPAKTKGAHMHHRDELDRLTEGRWGGREGGEKVCAGLCRFVRVCGRGRGLVEVEKRKGAREGGVRLCLASVCVCACRCPPFPPPARPSSISLPHI